MTFRVGIIGANWGTFAHLPAWRALPDVEVVAVCTSRRETAQAAASKHGIERAFWDAAAMSSDPAIDIIDCGTRPSVRAPMVLTALRHGKHVYSGIPFAADLEQARQLRDAWRECGTVAAVDAFSQWLPAHRCAKELLEAGVLGQPFGGICTFNLSLFNVPNPHFPYNWFAQAGLGVSALRNLGSHALHLLTFLLGPIAELIADDGQLVSTWRFPDGAVIEPQTNDFACLLLRFVSGLRLQLQLCWSATLAAGWSVDVFGAQGRLLIEAPSFPTSRETALYVGTLRDGQLQRVEMPQRLLHAPGVAITAEVEPQPAYPMALSMQQLIQAVQQGGAVAPDFEQAWNVERTLEAARRSSLERRWISLEEVR